MRRNTLRQLPRTTLVLVLLVSSGTVWAKGLSVGAPAPSIEATLLDGGHFSLAAQRGKVVVVNVWATWCGPCRAEMPALDAFYRAHREQGLVLVGISADDRADTGKVREALRRFTYPAAMLDDTRMSAYGRLWRMPLTFVVDRDGVLRRDGFKAAPTVDAASLEREVLPLLQH